MSVRKRLPIGIQTFREIRDGGFYYVDKTGFALRLADEAKYFFLSRPRRFGKSLFLDTLAELFAGNEALFEGLEAHGRWDWSRRHPVVRIGFGGGVLRDRDELDGLDRAQIRDWYNGYNWTGEAVYNPFDVLLLFDKRQFRPWWFETATPTFLVDVLTERETWLPALGQLETDAALLSTFDVGHMPTEALLFQTGYLTIAEEEQVSGAWFYRLRYPNREVYLFEFKVVELEPDGSALAQIKARGYADRYRGSGQTIHLIGVEFSRERRGVTGFAVESL